MYHTLFSLRIILCWLIICVLFQLNPSVNVFQRKYVNEVKKCEEMERILGKNICGSTCIY